VMSLKVHSLEACLSAQLWATGVRPLGGAVSGVALAVLGALSMPWVRRNAYSVFLVGHITMALTAVGGVAFHTTYAWRFLAPAAGLYVLDRLYQAAVLTPSTQDGRLSVAGGSEGKTSIAKLVVSVRGRGTEGWQGGSWALVQVPAVSLMTHPISVSCVERVISKDDTTKTVLTFHVAATARAGSWSQELLALARTRRDGDHCEVRLRGPFGSLQVNPKHHTKILLVGGGIGITPMMSVAEDLLHDSACDGKQLTMVWVSRSTENLDALGAEVKALEVRGRHLRKDPESTVGALRVRCFVTRGDGDDARGSVKTHTGSGLTYTCGRPDLAALLAEELEGETSACALACGPETLVRCARAAAARVGAAWHEESFAW